jgi:hypothetical protein
MRILDVEYKFDRHKLTVFFEANENVDFRYLVSDMFSLYKTHIWMQQVEVEGSSTGFFTNQDDGEQIAATEVTNDTKADSSLLSDSCDDIWTYNRSPSQSQPFEELLPVPHQFQVQLQFPCNQQQNQEQSQGLGHGQKYRILQQFNPEYRQQ